MRHRPRRRQAHPAADRLHEAGRRGADLGLGWMSGRWTAGKRSAAGPTRTVVAPMWPWPRWPAFDDPAVFDLDERPQLVRLAEAVGRPELLEVLEALGRRFVVVGDAQLERDLRRTGDGFGRDPGHGGDGRLETLRGHGDHLERECVGLTVPATNL